MAGTLPLLRIDNLSVSFLSDGQRTNAVNAISLEVARGEILALVGESGSGKSVTSLSILQLLPQPPAQFDSGSIVFSEDGMQALNLLKASKKELQAIRGNKVAMIFQEPMTSLNPVMQCGKQVMEALLQHRNITRKEARQCTIEWFRKVKLPEPEQLFHKYPHQLSGGQKQRVMIAMAMCCEPSLLICDEPTTALDVTVQKTILQLIRDLQREQNMGVIFITHDLGVVAEIADRVAIMYKGSIVEQGQARKIFRQASHPYTQALIACRPAGHDKGSRLPVVSDFLEGNTAPVQQMDREHKTSDEVLISVKNLVVRFPTKTNFLGTATSFHTAVKDVSFDIYNGETLGLVGESGCGKTTLGRAMLKLVAPASGSIHYKGTNITALSKDDLQAFRKDVQLVFQDPYSSLNPRLTIGAAIAEPMRVTKMLRTGTERRARVAALLDRVNLPASVMNRYPHEFSGGQRQRIIIARALSMNPDFLVCDESVSALDVSVQAQVLNLLNELKKDLGLTMLFISHDLSVVRYMCDRIMVMQEGRIVESGEAESIYHAPQHPYTTALLSAIPTLRN